MIDFIPEGLDDLALLGIVIGFFQPIVLNFILQSKWSARVQSLVAFAFSVIVAVVTLLIMGALTGVTLVTAALTIAVASIAFYQGFWKKVLPEMKSATDVTKRT